MTINYIILAHKHPGQLRRLIEKLSDSDCFFYVHIDKGRAIEPFLSETAEFDNIYFASAEQREYGTWGDIGIVRATLNLVEQILSDGRNGYCILLSGQDYPVTNVSIIRSYLLENSGSVFMSYFPIPSADWCAGGIERISQYKFNISNRRGDFVLCPSVSQKDFYSIQTIKKVFKLLIRRKIRFLLMLLKRRPGFPAYLMPFGGDQWWSMPTDIAKEIIGFLHEHPDYLEFHEHTLLPDEIFFQSIILHLNQVSPLKIKPTLTYINWQRKNVPLPVTFTEHDREELTNLPIGKFFARKFDMDIDNNILDTLDEVIASNSHQKSDRPVKNTIMEKTE
ncbi:MAG TPA: beta-1,6-N-acetylglucosaminyltransferase [Sphingobacteriaceae bacterium]